MTQNQNYLPLRSKGANSQVGQSSQASVTLFVLLDLLGFTLGSLLLTAQFWITAIVLNLRSILLISRIVMDH